MTNKARMVLQDCKYALRLHRDNLQGEYFRISWVSIITLLRAVGHVLDKVDSDSSPEMKKAIEQKWDELQKSKPEPMIFWEFIEKERNNVIKLYEYGIERHIELDGPILNGEQTYILIDCVESQGGQILAENGEYKSFINDGPFKGKKEIDIVKDAIKFWEEYLDKIDTLVVK